MDSIKDLGALCAVLMINVSGWASGVTALFGVLPIPHTWHDWGLTLGSAIIYLIGRIRDRKRVRRRLRAIRPASVAIDPPAADMPVPARAVRRAHAAAIGVETHSQKMRKSASN
jgi:hypothetical protein